MSCEICRRPGIIGLCSVCEGWLKHMAHRETFGGQIRALYFEGGQLVGERIFVGKVYEDSSGSCSSYYNPNKAMFCHTCGELWARVIHEYSFEYRPMLRTAWDLEHRLCPRCGDGQLLFNTDLDGCSKSLLRRETELLLFLERNHG